MQFENIHKVLITTCFNAKEVTIFHVIVESIYVELINPIDSSKAYTDVRVDEKNLCLMITVHTESLSHLRAIVNSVMYLIHAAVTTAKLVSNYLGIK